MYFEKHPRKIHSLRSDCCSFLKDDKDECISLNLSNETMCTGYLRITLRLKTHPDISHFFKLCQFNDKGKSMKEELLEVFHDIRTTTDREVVELKFFGIKKATKAEALEFIKNIPNTNDYNEIYKRNSSVFFLNIELVNQYGCTISNLCTELQVGNQGSDDLCIKCYAPKTICDIPVEITFFLNNPIKDETKCPEFEIESHDHTCAKTYKHFNCPAKNVIVYTPKLRDLPADKFRGRLVSDFNKSKWVKFSIHKSITERGKRKCLSSEGDNSNSKIPKYMDTPSTSGSSDGNHCINDNVINNKKAISEVLYKKMLCEIACCAHDYALAGSVTEKQWKIIQKVPIVCILQDNLRNSPLHYAVHNNQEIPVKYFLSVITQNYQTEIDAVNIDGNTPLMLSVICNSNLTIIKELISCGASIYLENKNGKSVFNLSIDNKNGEVFDILLDKAKKENQIEEKHILSWIINIVQQQYYDGFSILCQNFQEVLSYDMDMECLSEDEQTLFKQYVLNHTFFNQNILDLLDCNYFSSAVEEHDLDNIISSDQFGFDCDMDYPLKE